MLSFGAAALDPFWFRALAPEMMLKPGTIGSKEKKTRGRDAPAHTLVVVVMITKKLDFPSNKASRPSDPEERRSEYVPERLQGAAGA